MNRRILFIACLSVFGAASAGAQSQSAKPSAALDISQQKFVGLWEGSYSAHSTTGGYRLEIAHDSAWKVTTDFIGDHAVTAQGRDFKVDGATATWTQSLMGETCTTTAKLDGAQLIGETKCSQIAIGFKLRKTQ